MEGKETRRGPRGRLFQDFLREQLRNPALRRAYDAEGKKLSLGLKIHELRKRSGLTQAQLARKVHVTQGYIAQLETADAKNYEMKTLQKISEALGAMLVIDLVPAQKRRELVHA